METNYEFFMKTDVSEYIGEWIAIIDSNIVAHGKNLKEVLNQAKQIYPGKRPLIAKIPDKETMIF